HLARRTTQNVDGLRPVLIRAHHDQVDILLTGVVYDSRARQRCVGTHAMDVHTALPGGKQLVQRVRDIAPGVFGPVVVGTLSIQLEKCVRAHSRDDVQHVQLRAEKLRQLRGVPECSLGERRQVRRMQNSSYVQHDVTSLFSSLPGPGMSSAGRWGRRLPTAFVYARERAFAVREPWQDLTVKYGQAGGSTPSRRMGRAGDSTSAASRLRPRSTKSA